LAQVEKQGNRLLVSGSMTMNSVNTLLGESVQAFSSAGLEIDLAAVSDVDSSAVSLLLEWVRQAHEHNASLVFVNLPKNLLILAELYGVLEFIPQRTTH